jgi:hypothetical protein
MSHSCTLSVRGRSGAAILIALSTSIVAASVSGQQVIPFGDVPATPDFTEQEIAARGERHARDLTYSDWSKLCFKGVQGPDTKIVCRTTINGKWDTGQIAQGRSDRTRRCTSCQAPDFRSSGILLAARYQAGRRQGALDARSLHDLPCQWMRRRNCRRSEFRPRNGVRSNAFPRCSQYQRHDPWCFAAARQLRQGSPGSSCPVFRAEARGEMGATRRREERKIAELGVPF